MNTVSFTLCVEPLMGPELFFGDFYKIFVIWRFSYELDNFHELQLSTNKKGEKHELQKRKLYDIDEVR